jgi:arabinogalactan oligomer/maltooligosaccharide transport system substrate-binding protein
MKRKVLSVMLCAAMVVSMTACGGSDAKENTASANASVSETEQGEATEQDAQEEEPITCTLTVWSPSEDQDPEYGQWLNLPETIVIKFYLKSFKALNLLTLM